MGNECSRDTPDEILHVEKLPGTYDGSKFMGRIFDSYNKNADERYSFNCLTFKEIKVDDINDIKIDKNILKETNFINMYQYGKITAYIKTLKRAFRTTSRECKTYSQRTIKEKSYEVEPYYSYIDLYSHCTTPAGKINGKTYYHKFKNVKIARITFNITDMEIVENIARKIYNMC